MSRGPTRRVRRLLASGAVSEQVLMRADHEADLLAHPYIGAEHVTLARLHLAGQLVERDSLRRNLAARGGALRRWWRPRGPRSALRRLGLAETEAARRAAEREDRSDIV